MSTIEFYGAGGLEMTNRLKDALGRYAMHCVPLNGNWKFIASNLDEKDVQDQENQILKTKEAASTDLRLLSIPFYYQNEEQGYGNDPFFSFEKVIIGNDDESVIPKIFIELCKEAHARDGEIRKKEAALITNQIKILNIQSGDFEYWKEQLNQMLESKDTIYIFYWQNQVKTKGDNSCQNPDLLDTELLKKTRSKYDIKDKVWGYSKFLRDFLKIRNRCFELEYNEIKHFSDTEIKNLIDLKVKKIEPFPSYTLLSNNVQGILNDFGLQKHDPDFDMVDLSRLHLYNRNNHFQSDYFELNFMGFVKSATGSAHHLLHEKDDLLLRREKSSELGGVESKLFFYDLFKNITEACVNFLDLEDDKIPEFVFLDDLIPDKLKNDKNKRYWNKYNRLRDWFPKSNFYYSDNIKFLDLLFNTTNDSQVKQDNNAFKFNFVSHNFEDYSIINFNQVSRDNPLFIGIDIDWNGEQYGFELLKQFRRNVHLMKRPCFIFVFSRFEYPSAIRKAVASGALFYITKQNYMNLVHKVYLILRRMNPKEIIHPKYRTYESWHLLNKLEPAKIVQLKSEVIKGVEYEKTKYSLDIQTHAWKWIQKLPKAELHCHIGSCLGPDLLPMTALLVLAEKYNDENKSNRDMNIIIQFVSLLVKKLQLEENKVLLKDEDLIKAFGSLEKKYNCVFELLSNECKLTENMLLPEVVLLSPQCSIIDRLLPNIDITHDYFKLRSILLKEGINYDDVMLFFILFLFIKENGIDNKSKFNEKILMQFKQVFPNIQGSSYEISIKNLIGGIDGQTIIPDINTFVDRLYKNFKHVLIEVISNKGTNLLGNLQSSRGKSNSLFTYLRGCEYGGAAHMQTKISIFLACHYIVCKYAMPQNIRYLTLRCAVDGYAKSGLLNQDQAMQALLKGFDAAVKKACQVNIKVHVDLILAAKRHKTVKEFEENVALALQYRNGLDLPKGFREELKGDFFNSRTKVVSFDLAGLEEGNRASKYLPQFMPLLKKCFPITIHAGEDDLYESVWEAIYLVQSQRIGHALSLRDNQDLIELVRDRHIAIELCPLSNILTRKKKFQYPKEGQEEEFRNGGFLVTGQKMNDHEPEYNKQDYYPLRQYLMENLDVTINTDNPYVSGSTLTEEFLIAAKLAGGLTKWEILRLIKNSFRSAALPKEQKKLLMNEIDDEIYNLLLVDR